MTDDAKAVEMGPKALAETLLTCSATWINEPFMFEVQQLAKAFLALSEKCERYEKVVDAAKDMGQRLQSLPWHRSDGGSDAPYCLSFNSWKNWNYGECQKLLNALSQLEPGDSDV